MNLDYKTHFLLLFSIVGLAACGSGSDDGATEGEPVVDSGGELASLETQGRDIAIDMLELVDTIDYLGSMLLPSVASIPTGIQSCSGVGETLRTDTGGVRTIQWSNCKYSDESELVLSGSVVSGGSTMTTDVSHEITELTMTQGNRSVTVNGNLSAVAERLSSESLVVNEGSGDYSMSSLQFQKSSEGTLSTIEVSASVNIARLAVDATLVVGPSLQWTQSGCPSSGRLEISLSPSLYIAVDGNGGESVLYTQGGNSDTIACTEIETLVGGSGSSIFQPPVPPN